jgi:hypothetical protein
MVLKNVNERFSYNLLSLNFGKAHFMQFIIKHPYLKLSMNNDQ